MRLEAVKVFVQTTPLCAHVPEAMANVILIEALEPFVPGGVIENVFGVDGLGVACTFQPLPLTTAAE